jgi:hypothetical protein
LTWIGLVALSGCGADSDAAIESQPDPTQRSVAYGGIEFDVPREFATNALECGQATSDTVVLGSPGSALCLGPVSTSTVVRVGESESIPAPGASAPTERIDVGGTVVDVVTGTSEGNAVVVASVPARGMSVSMVRTDPTLVTSILDSLRVVDVDAHGCPTNSTSTDAAAAVTAAVDAAAGALCLYSGGVHRGSAAIDPADVVRIERALADTASSTPRARERDACYADPSWYVLRLPDDGAVVRASTISFDGCGEVGVRDGAGTRPVSTDLIEELIRTVPFAGSWSTT